jgi:cardiolipin synthase
MLRLAMVPVFAVLIVSHHDGWALAVLAFSGFTDWLDGKLARALNQMSRLGQMLDPVADRLYIFATVVGLALRDIIPWWLAIALPLRDVLLMLTLPALHRRGFNALPVHFLGKSATFCLLYAFPLLLLGDGDSTLNLLARVFGWAFAIWGTGLYYWAGALYFAQLRHLVQTVKPIKDAAG